MAGEGRSGGGKEGGREKSIVAKGIDLESNYLGSNPCFVTHKLMTSGELIYFCTLSIPIYKMRIVLLSIS